MSKIKIRKFNPAIYADPQFHLQLLGSLASWQTWRHLMAKVGTS